jgi:hypothetical protein
MTRTRLNSLILFVLGLIGIAIVAGIFQAHGGSLSGDAPIVAIVIPMFFISLLLVLVPGCVLLSDRFPSGERAQAPGDRFRLGVLSHFPLAVGLLNSVIEQNGLSGLDVPRAILNGAGVTVAFWFLHYCIRDLTARKTPIWTMVMLVIVLLLGNLLAIPIYWWFYLRPRPTRQVAIGSELTTAGA